MLKIIIGLIRLVLSTFYYSKKDFYFVEYQFVLRCVSFPLYCCVAERK